MDNLLIMLSFDILQILIISNNSGSAVLDMVYETGIGSSNRSVKYSTDVFRTFAMTVIV